MEDQMHSHMEKNELTQPLILSKATFYDKKKEKLQYLFVMYSPSFEVFKRMHAILSQNPEIAENIRLDKDELDDELLIWLDQHIEEIQKKEQVLREEHEDIDAE